MKHSNDPFWVLKYYSMIHFVILHFLDKIMTVFKEKSKQYDFNLSFFLKLFISIPLLLFLTSGQKKYLMVEQIHFHKKLKLSEL